MTLRPRSTSPRSTSRSTLRSPVRSVVENLLGGDGQHRLWPGQSQSGRVAVVRGFDVGSREFRGAIRDAAAAQGWSSIDLPVTPAFGALPAGEVRLVVVARASLLPLGERCAAHWGAHLLGPAVAVTDPSVFSQRSAPGLRATSAAGARDAVAARLSISGPARYRIGGGPQIAAESLALEPSTAGILVESGTREATGLRMAERPLEFELDREAEAMLDGHPTMLAPGRYTVTARPTAFHRVVVDHEPVGSPSLV